MRSRSTAIHHLGGVPRADQERDIARWKAVAEKANIKLD
jgi:hypothetical protein